jgi:hypothetical protein
MGGLNDRLARWLATRPESMLAAVQAGAVAAITWAGAALSIALVTNSNLRFAALSVTGLVAIAALSFGARYLSLVRDRFLTRREGVLDLAHSHMGRLLTAELEDIAVGTNVCQISGAPLVSIQRTTDAVFDMLDSKFQDKSVPGERIHFEACFMTTSYRDPHVTILAYKNSDGRMPTSLTLRVHDSSIYDRTEAADLYREAASRRPEPRLIADTSNNVHYEHLYPRQRQRIASTLVYPVLSASSVLLGVLVATADRRLLFETRDELFWFSLFEVYSNRLALDKARLDEAVRERQVTPPA